MTLIDKSLKQKVIRKTEEDILPSFADQNWQVFGGFKPPVYVPVDYGFNYLMSLRIYSVITASIVADGSITKKGLFEISQSLDTFDKLQYVRYLINSLYPIISNIYPFAVVEKSQTNSFSFGQDKSKEYKSRAVIRTASMFKFWESSIYQPLTNSLTKKTREKILTPVWKNIIVNNLQLANWIAQDGSRDYSVNETEVNTAYIYDTRIHIGNCKPVELFKSLFEENYLLKIKQSDHDTKNREQNIILQFPCIEGGSRKNPLVNQSRLFVLTHPFLTTEMQRKVIPTALLGQSLANINLSGLALDQNGNPVAKDRPSAEDMQKQRKSLNLILFMTNYQNTKH